MKTTVIYLNSETVAKPHACSNTEHATALSANTGS